MKNLWQEEAAQQCTTDLELRVYTSNLLGQSNALVLHGGGNTSVKSRVEDEEVLFVKGSGWDLVSIEAEGFAPVKMDTLLAMAARPSLSDTEMVTGQKAAMLDPNAPNPSVEAILHALIPFKFVDHTHADAIVTISNSRDGDARLRALFPDFLILPYVMPGFLLARTIHEQTRDFDWGACGGILLHHHGIFTFDDDARKSYDKMIAAVTRAEAFLDQHAPLSLKQEAITSKPDLKHLGQLIEAAKGHPVTLRVNQTPLARTYASQPDLAAFATRGVLTPEHILRTKRTPLVLENDRIDQTLKQTLEQYMADYRRYFDTYATDEIMLNPAPNYAVIKDFGVVLFGRDEREASILNDVVEHTMLAVLRADRLGGYESISVPESFAMEYWELEQAKLKPKSTP